MKHPRLLRLVLGLTTLALTSLTASAEGPGDGPREGKRGRSGKSRTEARPPAEGLQLSGGLQTSSLQPSVSFARRLSDAEWRQRFPIKTAEK